MKNYDKSFLNGLEQNADGSFQKKKTVSQPREVLYVNKNTTMRSEPYAITGHPVTDTFRTITLTLFGEPMPKQGDQSGLNKQTGKIYHYQPKSRVDRKNDYIAQILKQLPADFKPFTKEVHVTKFHCVFQPLKAFHKMKGRMEAIRNGERFYKTTQPDLIDNLKKLIFDSMAKIVLENDGLIVTENDTAKYYGIGGMVIVELKGK